MQGELRKRGELRKIDPALGLGLHELAYSEGPFRLQLEFAKEQTEDILNNLNDLIENTRRKAPKRPKDFCLNRRTKTVPKNPESMWERPIFYKWELAKSKEDYLPFCKKLVTYQFPLYAFRKKGLWGAIDLQGIGNDSLPVPNELKQHAPKAAESPLRMLVVMAAYGITIREDWPYLKKEWLKHLKGLGEHCPRFPDALKRLTLVGVAPKEYWSGRLGLPGKDPGAFLKGAWKPFWALVDALGEWFNIHFVEVEGTYGNSEALPTVSGVHALDLRKLTLEPVPDVLESNL